MTFQIGNIVKLKSGGPEMTVQSIDSDSSPYLYCQWFAGKKLESGRFPTNSLDYVEQDTE